LEAKAQREKKIMKIKKKKGEKRLVGASDLDEIGKGNEGLPCLVPILCMLQLFLNPAMARCLFYEFII